MCRSLKIQIFLLLTLLFFIGLSLTLRLPEQSVALIFWQIRLPRVLNACLVGLSLGLLGTAVQTIFHNPLADTSLTGINSGAALGVAATLLLLPKWLPDLAATGIFSLPWVLQLLAVAVGTAVALFMVLLIRYFAHTTQHVLFVGLALMLLTSAVMTLLMTLHDDLTLQTFLFWSLGSFQLSDPRALWYVAPLVLCFSGWLWLQRKRLDLLWLGADAAKSLGLDVARFDSRFWWVAAIWVALCMSLAGGIGWIGLISAHFSRRWVGARHAHLLPCAGLLGANIAVCADLASAHIWYPQEVPVGAMIALLGVMVFVSLFRQK